MRFNVHFYCCMFSFPVLCFLLIQPFVVVVLFPVLLQSMVFAFCVHVTGPLTVDFLAEFLKINPAEPKMWLIFG